VETDDNVGLLALTDTDLVVLTEQMPIIVPRSDIIDVQLERMIELPYLQWIRVKLLVDGVEESILLSSRQAGTLRQGKRATRRLAKRLTDWWADEQLRWLEEERGVF
jgi:hypothetical protein